MPEIKKVGLIGYGYWGQKLAKTLDKLGVLTGIAESNQARRLTAHEELQNSNTMEFEFDDYSVMLKSHEFDGIIIATPPETHYDIAQKALFSGYHVFVEKPMTTNYEETKDLASLAVKKNLSLKTGHIYLHCPGLLAIPKPVGPSDLTIKLYNIGGAPSDSTRELKWAGLPHAVSIACHFFPLPPERIVDIQIEKERITFTLVYRDCSIANIDVADYTGVRMRHIELRSGNEKWIFNADDPYNHHIPGPPIPHEREVELDQELKTFSGLALGAGRFNIGLMPYKEPPDHPDPLTLEMKDFLTGEGIDTIGIKVAKIIDQIKNED